MATGDMRYGKSGRSGDEAPFPSAAASPNPNDEGRLLAGEQDRQDVQSEGASTNKASRVTEAAIKDHNEGAWDRDKKTGLSWAEAPESIDITIIIMDHKGRGYGLAARKGVVEPVLTRKYTLHKAQHIDGGFADPDDHPTSCNAFEKEVATWDLDHAGTGREFNEDFIQELKEDKQYPLALLTGSPKEKAQGEQVKQIQISGSQNYYLQICTAVKDMKDPHNDKHKGSAPVFWISAELRPGNPFLEPERGCCTKRSYVNHMVKILRVFSFIDLQEEEDQETERYLDVVKFLLFGGKKDGHGNEVAMSRYLEEGTPAWQAANKEEARTLPFEDEMDDGTIGYRFLMMPETDDWYEVQHRNFMKNRIRIEMQDTAQYCVKLFYFALVQFVLGWCLLGVGVGEKDGGNKAVFIASVCCGAVMSLSSVIGWLASLSANEEYIQRFMVSSLVTMSFLTTFVYLEIKYTWDNFKEDAPGTQQLGPAAAATANAADNRTKSVTALIFSILALAITFFNCYVCQQALDTINDLGALQDDALVFRYFQVRLTEMKKTCEQLACAHYRTTNPKVSYSGPKSMTQWWTRSHYETCGTDFPAIMNSLNSNKSIAISSGAVDNSIVAPPDDEDDEDEGPVEQVTHQDQLASMGTFAKKGSGIMQPVKSMRQ